MKLCSIVLCAGKSTRFFSKKSKLLQDLWGKPLCFFSINLAKTVSSFKPIIVLNHQKEELIKALDEIFLKELTYVTQENLLGTAQGVKEVLPLIPNDADAVLVLFGDTPLIKKESLLNLINTFQKEKPDIAMLTSSLENPHGYGRIIRDNKNNIIKIIEETECNDEQKNIKEINTGVCIYGKDFLIKNIIKIDNNNCKQEYFLTDICMFAKSIKNFEISNSENLGVNSVQDLVLVRDILKERILNDHMNNSVFIIDKKSTYIDYDVLIKNDVTIYPGVYLKGNSIIEKNTTILPYSIIENSHIGEENKIGPFSYIRPGTKTDIKVKIGSFSELKSSSIGSNTKMGHFGYVGDANIGDNVNLGAGLVVCNFDGKNKHKTIIKNNVFVGSNSSLIAPIEIEEDSYIGAGSVITKNVPQKHLAIARNKQKNIKKVRL